MALNKCKLIMNIFLFKTLKGLVNLIFLGYKWWRLNDFSNRGNMVNIKVTLLQNHGFYASFLLLTFIIPFNHKDIRQKWH
jgi:hypothetical protein